MIFDLQQVINSSFGLHLVSSLAQTLPPRWGYRLAYALADQIARRRASNVVRALRANQWMVSGEIQDSAVLDQIVRETLRHSSHSLFDLYHYNDKFDLTRQLLVFDPSFDIILRRQEFEARGLMIAGLHLSSFDLVLQWACKNGLQPMVLTIPKPQGARQIEYEIRRRTGMNLVPASVGAFRQALKHLQRGGMVLTGIDRPIENPEIRPRFFGRPSALPIHHIFLAVKARVPVILTVAYRRPDGKYHVFASEPIEMDDCPDASDAILSNAEKVLAVAEGFIQRSPRQWSVPLPVWPESMHLAP